MCTSSPGTKNQNWINSSGWGHKLICIKVEHCRDLRSFVCQCKYTLELLTKRYCETWIILWRYTACPHGTLIHTVTPIARTAGCISKFVLRWCCAPKPRVQQLENNREIVVRKKRIGYNASLCFEMLLFNLKQPSTLKIADLSLQQMWVSNSLQFV